MRFLVVGSGGREHALCWSLARDATVFCAPGNPGTATVATNLPLDPADHDRVAAAAREHRIDCVVVGPEAPLAAGIVDHVTAAGVPCFGPTARAARIEASKAFAKDAMAQAGVPTPAARTFTAEAPALDYVAGHPEPLVVKASGLAAGKGVVVCATRQEACDAVRAMFGGAFGDAGREILIEQYAEGEELSVLALTDGEQVMLLPPSQDHKRVGEGDTGPNTGGMGAYTPVSRVRREMLRSIGRTVFEPMLAHLADTGAPYIGVLYAGIMIGSGDEVSVLEFNCRLGDPEAQAVLPVLPNSLAEHIARIATGGRWRPEHDVVEPRGAAVTTVVATPGYPGRPRTGDPIRIPDMIPEGTLLFHAGTASDPSGTLRTAGGRVLCATGLAGTVAEAAARSRALAEAVEFDGRHFRRDIAWREIVRAGAA